MRLVTLYYPVGAQLDGREGETSAAINLVEKMFSLILTLNPSSEPIQKKPWRFISMASGEVKMFIGWWPLHYILAINILLRTC